MSYVYIWSYRVRAECMDAFLEAYRANGRWAELFRKHTGYCRTELLRDRNDPLRFVTIDHWESAADWERFRAESARDFEQLDVECEGFTVEEVEIGRFEAAEARTG